MTTVFTRIIDGDLPGRFARARGLRWHVGCFTLGRMTSVRIEKAFIRVLNALAELEALSSNDAFVGAEAWAARLETRLERYLALAERVTTPRPDLSMELLRALLGRVKDAVASGSRPGVFSAAADLRDQLAAHFHALQGERPGPAP